MMNTSQFKLDLNTKIMPTGSTINIDSLSGQNKRLIEYLLTGEHINMMHPMKVAMGIGYLNSRIADLRKFLQYSNFKIESKMIEINDVSMKDYWLVKI